MKKRSMTGVDAHEGLPGRSNPSALPAACGYPHYAIPHRITGAKRLEVGGWGPGARSGGL